MGRTVRPEAPNQNCSALSVVAAEKVNLSDSTPRRKGVRDTDVLLGQGPNLYHHPGNQRFNQLVDVKAAEYANMNHPGKKYMTYEIVRQLRDEGARFMQEKSPGCWKEEVDGKEARKKVSNRFQYTINRQLNNKGPRATTRKGSENDSKPKTKPTATTTTTGTTKAQNQWSPTDIPPLPVFPPLDEKSSAFVSDDAKKVTKRLSECFQFLGLPTFHQASAATIQLKLPENEGITLNLWEPLGSTPGIIVELQTANKESRVYQLCSQYILDAATGLFDAYKHTLRQLPPSTDVENAKLPSCGDQASGPGVGIAAESGKIEQNIYLKTEKPATIDTCDPDGSTQHLCMDPLTVEANGLVLVSNKNPSTKDSATLSNSAYRTSEQLDSTGVKDMEMETKEEMQSPCPKPMEERGPLYGSSPSNRSSTVSYTLLEGVSQAASPATRIASTSKKTHNNSLAQSANAPNYKVLPTQMQKMRRFRRQAHRSPSSSFNLDADMKMRPLPSSTRKSLKRNSFTPASTSGGIDKHSNYSTSGSLNSGVSVEMQSLPSRQASFNSRVSVEMNSSIPSSAASFSSQLSMELLSISSRSGSLTNTLLNLEILTLPSSAASYSSHNSSSMKLHSLPSRSASFTSSSQKGGPSLNNHNHNEAFRRRSLPLRSASCNSGLRLELQSQPSSHCHYRQHNSLHKSQGSLEWHALSNSVLDEPGTAASVFSSIWGDEDHVPLDISVHAPSAEGGPLQEKEMSFVDTRASHALLPPSTIFLASLTK